MDFSKLLFRASGNGYIMTDPKTKAAKEAGELGESVKTHLVDIYVREKYGRQTDIQNKYVIKGNAVEEDSITLYSRVKKTFFKKNERHLKNEFIMGTPDLYTGLEITEADTIIDVKSSWDIYTFFRTMGKTLNNIYYWQLQSYMALTGARNAKLAYCLVNTPDTLIADEKKKLLWKMGMAMEESQEYIDGCREIERASIFDDIPLNERCIEFEVKRDNEAINGLYERVKKCREHLQALDEMVSSNGISKLIAA